MSPRARCRRGGGGRRMRRYARVASPLWPSTASATSRSSPTSTTASRRSPTACSSSPARSTRATCATSTSTRWTSNASGASRSSSSRCGSTTATTSSTSSTRPATSTSATRCRGPWPPARASSSSSTRPRASRPRRWPTATWPSSTTSRSWPPSTRSTSPPPTPTATRPRSRRSSASRPTRSCASAPRRAQGVGDLLDAVIERVPPPAGDASEPLQALIFDSHYDPYRGVVSSVRVVNGSLTTGSRLRFMQAGAVHDADEVGVRTPGQRARRLPRPRRDRLPHRRHQGRGRGPLGRDGHRGGAARARPRCRATRTPSRWCSAASTRSTATSSATCASRCRSCG